MTTIKIISDPYKRNIDFEVFNDTTEEWEQINYQNNPDSGLLSEEVKKNFFPYKAKDIIKILQKEYGNDLQVIFEGTNDEFNELVEICQETSCIELKRSDLAIENARDILPKIVGIFSEIQPIVEKNIASETRRRGIEKDIARFLDASDDIVPICVLGNYSSGKSTFINALIGLEILPTGDMPVTAKIYKIKQAHEADSAKISFDYNNRNITICFEGQSFDVDSGTDNDLSKALQEELNNCTGQALSVKVNRCLEEINRHHEGVSDLIDIEIPFATGPLSGSKNSFVIFDTPGSNTATYKDHFSILEEAMKNLSNGIPIYVAEYNSLDTCDNESLYEKIKSISQIDSRFTMIVVNKADAANIKEKTFDESMEQMILSQAVPRNLYSGGIYFISSIMGLGSKNGGEFADEHAAEFFEGNERKYSDPSSKWYKTLYKYNIMPDQIKQSIISVSENEQNKILANSGLLAIEHEIVNFAEKYSAYDKCKQSDKYVGNIIDETQKEILETKAHREAHRQNLMNQLAAEKRELIQSVVQKSDEAETEYKASYDESLKDCLDSESFSYEYEDMVAIERGILEEKQDEHEYLDRMEDLKKSGSEIINSFKRIGKTALSETVKDIKEDVKAAMEDAREWHDTKVQADRETAETFLRVMSEDYDNRSDKAEKAIDKASRDYWESRTNEIKSQLSYIVANSATLDDEKKKELEEIIISYESLEFLEEHIFKKADFAKKVWLPGKVIYRNKINTRKLTAVYNKDYEKQVAHVFGALKDSHSNSFTIWLDKLVNKITDKIVDYSPKLSEQAKQIEEETRLIEELESTKHILRHYSDQIQSLMEWKALA